MENLRRNIAVAAALMLMLPMPFASADNMMGYTGPTQYEEYESWDAVVDAMIPPEGYEEYTAPSTQQTGTVENTTSEVTDPDHESLATSGNYAISWEAFLVGGSIDELYGQEYPFYLDSAIQFASVGGYLDPNSTTNSEFDFASYIETEYHLSDAIGAFADQWVVSPETQTLSETEHLESGILSEPILSSGDMVTATELVSGFETPIVETVEILNAPADSGGLFHGQSPIDHSNAGNPGGCSESAREHAA